MAATTSQAKARAPEASTARFDDDGRRIMYDGETWDYERRLGAGRFAAVHSLRCVTKPDRERIAAKVTSLAGISSWARSQLTEELMIWQTLDHPNVVKLHGHLSSATEHILLLELALGGELFERIISMQFFSEQLAARQVGEVLSALEYLHSFGVLHRDLKPENLLLESAADDARVKVADFGASKLVISCGAKTPCGSLGYAAPEQLRGLKFAQDAAYVPPYDKEVDLWSVGVITYILLSGSMPFDPAGYSAEAICRHNALDFPESLFGGVSAEALAFIRALLQVDPAKRLSASQALKHKWLHDSAKVISAATGPAAAFPVDGSGGGGGGSSSGGSASASGGANASGGGASSAAAAMMPPPTPMTPITPGLTPLPTPRRLKELQGQGGTKRPWGVLKEGWDRAAEAGKAAAAEVVAKAAAQGRTEGDAAREWAHKRTSEEMLAKEELMSGGGGGDEEPVTLMLPAEVSKKIRRGSMSNDSTSKSEKSDE